MPTQSILPIGILYKLIEGKLLNEAGYTELKEQVKPFETDLAQQLFTEVQSRIQSIFEVSKIQYRIEIIELSAFGQDETDNTRRGFCSLFAAPNSANLSIYKEIVKSIQIANQEKNIGPLVPVTAFYSQQKPFLYSSGEFNSNKKSPKDSTDKFSSDISVFVNMGNGLEEIKSQTIHGRFENFVKICSGKFQKNIAACAVPYIKDFTDDGIKTGGAIFLICSTESSQEDVKCDLLEMSSRLLLLAQLVAAKHSHDVGGVETLIKEKIFNKLFPLKALQEKWFSARSVVPHGFDTDLNEKLKGHIEAVLDKNAWLYQHAIATQKNELHEILKSMVGSHASCHDDKGGKGFGLNQIAIVAAAYFKFPPNKNFQFAKEKAILGKGERQDSKKTMKSLTDMFYALSLQKGEQEKVEITNVELSDNELCITFNNFLADKFIKKQKTDGNGDLTDAISEFRKYSRFSLNDANKESITTYCVLDNEREADNEIKFKFRSV